jgi:uncharacterized cupredoxin-like copper-binding protein
VLPTIALAATLLFAAVASAAPGHKPGEAHDHRAYGEPGDPRKPARIVQVTMREADGRMIFAPDRIAVRRGEQIRFRLRNQGALDHEIVVATLAENLAHAKEMEKFPEMEHDDPNAKRLKPGTSAEIVWRFTRAGEFDFSCLIPGHREAGMFGSITVK